MNKKPTKNKVSVPTVIRAGGAVLSDIRTLIESARGRVATYANAELTMLYWRVGERTRRDILKEKRAEYGQQIVATLSGQLVIDYGAGFSVPNLSRMVRIAQCFPDEKILSTLSKELSWSHFAKEIS